MRIRSPRSKGSVDKQSLKHGDGHRVCVKNGSNRLGGWV
jgi:hypothetical protein